MRAVELQEIEPGAVGGLGGPYELLAYGRESGVVERVRHLVDARAVRQRRGSVQRPVALRQGLVDAVPHEAGGALAAGVAYLGADGGAGRTRVHEVGDAPPGPFVLGRVQTGAAGGDAAPLADADHLGHDQARAAEGAGAEVDEVEVAGRAVLGAVHVHRRDDDAVAQGQSAQGQGREHGGRAGRYGRLALDGGYELRVAQPQVVVGDTAAAGEEVEGELPGRLACVDREVLEPFEAGAGRPLGGLHDGAALLLVRGERLGDRRPLGEAGGEREGVLDGELGAGADGEVGGVRGVADQDGVAVRPVLVDDRAEGRPAGVVAAQRTAAERVGEELAALVDGALLVAAVEAGGAPDLLAHLDDDGGRAGGVAPRGGVRVAVQLDDAVLRLGGLEAERVEGEVRGEPDVPAAVRGHAWPEGITVGVTGEAVHPVGGDDQVVRAGERRGGRSLGPEAELDAERGTPLVQNLQQPTTAEGRETVASRALDGAAVDHVDVVPAHELVLQRAVDDRVGVFDTAERLVGEDHAEAERVVGGVALPDGDLAAGIEALEESGGVETTGATADDGNAVRRRCGRFGRAGPGGGFGRTERRACGARGGCSDRCGRPEGRGLGRWRRCCPGGRGCAWWRGRARRGARLRRRCRR